MLAAVLAYAALALWLTRGASFTNEELIYVGESKGFSPAHLADPFGGHLTATTRFIYEAFLRLFGPTYLPFQIVVIAMVVTIASLMFVISRPRVGALPALTIAIIFLFLGSTPEVLNGWTTMWVQCVAAGLGAFVMIERDDRRADVVACALLLLSVLAFSIGVAFSIAAVTLLLCGGRRDRIWIGVVPLLVYAVWWLWALKFDEGSQDLTNLLLVPAWAADSFAAAAASLAGLSVDMTGPSDPLAISLGWGRLVAVGILLLVALGIRRQKPSPLFWAAIAFLAAMWFAEALSFSTEAFTRRTPDLDRYAYPTAIGIVLGVAAAWRGWRIPRSGLMFLAAVLAFSISANLWELRDRGSDIRSESDLTRARLGAIEIEQGTVDLGFEAVQSGGGVVAYPAGSYLSAVERFGGFGFTPAELEDSSAAVRAAADETLGHIASPTLEAVRSRVRCSPYASQVELPTAGGIIRTDTGGAVELRRFADVATVEAGVLEPGGISRIAVPPDDADNAWIASVAGGGVATCSIMSS